MTGASGTRPRIYLAGPDVFHRDSAAIFERLKALCDRLGLEGIEPTDGGLSSGLTGSDDELAQRIYDGNIALIRGVDGVIANLANFRGLEPDSGTVFEVGFATALGKPVVGYGVPPGSYADRIGAAIASATDDAGILRETGNGAMVEGLGQRLNLMLSRSTAIEATAEAALVRLGQTLALAAARA